MSAFTKNRKAIIVELELNDNRDTVNVIERIAKILGIEVGEHMQKEYVRTMLIRDITPRHREGAIE